MKPTLRPRDVTDLVERIERAQEAHARNYPPDAGVRQPVHTVHVPADRFTESLPADFGEQAHRLLDAHAPDGASLASAVGLGGGELADRVRERVTDKLLREPVEDLRIDVGNDYGVHDDLEEDRDVEGAARTAASAWEGGALPPFFGLQVKPYADGRHHRSIRTLDLFLTLLLDRCGRLPEGFVVTLPKVTMPEHVAVFVELLGRLEDTLGLPEETLRFEIQVETTESIVNHRGEVGLRRLVREAGSRLCGAHLDAFDYAAACGLPVEEHLAHPACDFARLAMQVAVAGTGVRLSDGCAQAIPAGEETAAVRAAWRDHAAQVRHSLRHGFYQGWDTHPAHLPARYAVVYAFHMSRLDAFTARLRAWSAHGGGNGGTGGRLRDETATMRTMLGLLRRAVDCGAVDEGDVLERAGLPSLEL